MSNNIKKISATKQFNRLFAGPIDPSSSWDSMEELKKYLKSPVCYHNQLVACNGKAYIIALKDGEKVLVEIGTGGNNNNNNGNNNGGNGDNNNGNGGGNNGGTGGEENCNCDFTDLWLAVNKKAEINHRHELSDIDLTIDGESIIVPGFHIGPEPPTDTSLLWIDTTEKELDTKISSKVLEEFRNTLTGMNKLILELRKEVAELKNHNCGNNTLPPITDPTGYYISTEDGFNIVTEDGYVLVSEDFIEGIYDDDFSLITEDGLYLATEDGYVLVSENYIGGIYDSEASLITEDGLYLATEDGYVLASESFIKNSLLTEDGLYIVTEDGCLMVSEDAVRNSLIAENGDYLVTESGDIISVEKIVAVKNEERTDLKTYLEKYKCNHCETEIDNVNKALNNKADIDHRHKQHDINNFPGLQDLTIMSKYHIGPEPPEDESKLWIDTSNGHVDQTIDMTIIDEIKTMITRMTNKINDLDNEIGTLRNKYGSQ